MFLDTVTISVLFLLLICFIALSWFAGSDAPYIPTKTKKVSKILKEAGVKKGKIFYELGSGDGRVVIEASKLGAIANGIEQSWLRVWYSRYKSKQLGLKNIYFMHGNVFDRHYYPADIVYIYLLTKAVLRLEEKLKKELKKGAVVVTQTYHFKKWKPFKKIDNFWLYKKS